MPSAPEIPLRRLLLLALLAGWASCAREQEPVERIPPPPLPSVADELPALAASERRAVQSELAKQQRCQQAQDIEGVLAALARALEIHPASRALRIERIRVLLGNTKEADPPGALQELGELHTVAPELKEHPEILILEARAAYRSHAPERCRRAATDLGSAALGPLAAEARFLLGSLDEQAGEFEAALQRFREARGMVPEYAYARFREGLMLFELGRAEQAAQAVERALEDDPDLAAAHFTLARIYRELGRTEEADREKEIHHWLDRYLHNPAQTEESYLVRFKALENLERLYPQYREGRIQLTRYRLIRALSEDAVRSARQLIADDPSDLQIYPLFLEAVRRSYSGEHARAEIDALLREVSEIPEPQREQLQKLVRLGLGR